jgi:hypothetical protein
VSAAERRTADAEALLGAALGLDLFRFVSDEVEDRLRARPNFLASTPASALVALRADVERTAGRLAREAGPALEDLRVWFGAHPGLEHEKEAGLAKVLAPRADEAARGLLRTYGFPGDAADDSADTGALDLHPVHELAYTPSSALLWAWRNLLGVDAARFAAQDGATPFELRFYLPEAL